VPINPDNLKALFTRIVSRLKEVEVELRAYKTTLEVANHLHPEENLQQTLQGFLDDNLARQEIYKYYDERLARFLESVDKAAKDDNLERLFRDVGKNPPKGPTH
jgi:Rap1-interacting factor 1-like protein